MLNIFGSYVMSCCKKCRDALCKVWCHITLALYQERNVAKFGIFKSLLWAVAFIFFTNILKILAGSRRSGYALLSYCCRYSRK